MSGLVPFPPEPLNAFLIEPGQTPRAGDWIALGGGWWRIAEVNGDEVTTVGGTTHTYAGAPLARECCLIDGTRYARY